MDTRSRFLLSFWSKPKHIVQSCLGIVLEKHEKSLNLGSTNWHTQFCHFCGKLFRHFG